MARGIPQYRFDSGGGGQREERLNRFFVEPNGKPKKLICLNCTAIIIPCDAAIDLGAGHTGWYTNPGGYRFYLGCFSRAPGCRADGPESNVNSWFPGYRWTPAFCTTCAAHLGWRFRSSIDQFYGLILTRLVDT